MGVRRDDVIKMALTHNELYHCFGDSIVTNVLMAIFGKLFDVDYNKKIEELNNDLRNH